MAWLLPMEIIFISFLLPMKNFIQKYYGYGIAALATILPVAASAQTSMTGGFLVPAGTTAALSTKVGTYLFATAVNTLFTAEMLGILVVLAVAGFIISIARRLWHGVRRVGR